jgi:Zn-dependent protease with chaperone function
MLLWQRILWRYRESPTWWRVHIKLYAEAADTLYMERLWQKINPTDSATLIARFLRQPEHRWIQGDFREAIVSFLATIPRPYLHKILVQRKLLFLYCNQHMSATFYQYRRREIVLIFPELLKRIQSVQKHQAFAVLAHEFGHVYHEHSQKRIGSLAAQVEADRFACELGYAEDLYFVLSGEERTHELVERLHQIKHHFQRSQQTHRRAA